MPTGNFPNLPQNSMQSRKHAPRIVICYPSISYTWLCKVHTCDFGQNSLELRWLQGCSPAPESAYEDSGRRQRTPGLQCGCPIIGEMLYKKCPGSAELQGGSNKYLQIGTSRSITTASNTGLLALRVASWQFRRPP